MVTAVFPAAGRGTRMGAGLNKVFLDLAGAPILTRSLLAFSRVAAVDSLVIVTAADEVAPLEKVLSRVSELKPWRVVEGGSERQYSVYRGLLAVPEESDIVLVHDAARPLITGEVITAVIDAAREHGAAIAAVPAKNTIKVVEDGFVQSTPERSRLYEVQTPQGFQKDLLLRAYEKAMDEDYLGTDDASLAERIGATVAVVESTYKNIKITTPEDLQIAKALLAETSKDACQAIYSVAGRAVDHLKVFFDNRRGQ